MFKKATLLICAILLFSCPKVSISQQTLFRTSFESQSWDDGAYWVAHAGRYKGWGIARQRSDVCPDGNLGNGFRQALSGDHTLHVAGREARCASRPLIPEGYYESTLEWHGLNYDFDNIWERYNMVTLEFYLKAPPMGSGEEFQVGVPAGGNNSTEIDGVDLEVKKFSRQERGYVWENIGDSFTSSEEELMRSDPFKKAMVPNGTPEADGVGWIRVRCKFFESSWRDETQSIILRYSGQGSEEGVYIDNLKITASNGSR
jgi:hypothetical protein